MENNYNKELCEERHERIEERLTKHGEQIDSLEKCVIKLTEMMERYDSTTGMLSQLGKGEPKPFATFSKVCGYTVIAVLGALSSWLVQYLEII